jgi:beta-glucosidase-like glycosyl hydrolase
LARCLFYLGLNMVWAGVVDHPREWPRNSYWEFGMSGHLDRLVRVKVAEGMFHLPLAGFTVMQ